jgi:hypothetical protein
MTCRFTEVPMTIFEKAILNMQRGTKRVSLTAVMFSERVRVEIAIVRLRIRVREVQDRIDEIYQGIGRRVVNLTRGEALPITTEQLIQDEEIATVMHELADQKQELEELNTMIKTEQSSSTISLKRTEGTGI